MKALISSVSNQLFRDILVMEIPTLNDKTRSASKIAMVSKKKEGSPKTSSLLGSSVQPEASNVNQQPIFVYYIHNRESNSLYHAIYSYLFQRCLRF